MLYERLVAESRVGDGLDGVRLGAIEKVRWLVDLLHRQRRNWTEVSVDEGGGYSVVRGPIAP